jgi:hypothetical protein
LANASTATWSGRSILWGRMRGLQTEPKNIKWGTGTVTGSANSDVALFSPATETGVVGTSTLVTTSFLADTYQVSGTLTCLVGAKTITEAILSDTVTLGGTTTVVGTSVSAAATSISVAAGASLIANAYAQIDNEVVLVTAINTNMITVTRGQLGSSAAIHAQNEVITVGGDGGAFANAGAGGQSGTVGAAQGGSAFAHADFAGIALSVNDSISFTFKDNLS